MSNTLISRFTDTPVMVAPHMAQWLGHCLADGAKAHEELLARQAVQAAVMQDDFWPAPDSWMASYRPYQVKGGTLSIPVKGVLVHDFGYTIGSWITGYTYIQKAFERAMSDPEVERIALMINSGGGEVAGNFDLVDRLYGLAGQKSVTAFVDEHAYSAAFSIATAAHRIVLPRTGGVGSVGVVTSHIDMSKSLDERGVKITFIHAGKHKVDGNPYEPLPPAVKSRIQSRINGLYTIFVTTVARNLGLPDEVVRNTEALTFSAEEAIDIGFAHEIAPIEEALAAYSGGNSTTVGVLTMSQTTEKPATQAENTTVAVDQAALDQARIEGRKEGAQAERERIQAILGCDEATHRHDLAFHLAMNTEQTVDVAKGILAAAPEQAPVAAVPTTPGADFAAAMTSGNPEIGDEGDAGNEGMDAGKQLIADYKAYVGE